MALSNRSRSLFLLLNLCFSASIFAQGADEFVYEGFAGAVLELVNGTAKVLPNGLLQLTNKTVQDVGHAFYPKPLNFNHSHSFSTEFVFVILTVPGVKTSGHGIAFTIASSIEFFRYASSSGVLGLFNSSNNGNSSNHVLAIEMDTDRAGEWEDINSNHVGIDLNSVISSVSAPAGYFDAKKEKNETLALVSGKPIRAWVDYDEDEMLLNVTIAPYRIQKPNRPLLSKRIKLSDIFLPEMYAGFSSSTGSSEFVSSQYVLGWSFSNNGQARSLNISRLPDPPPPPPTSAQSSTLKQILIKTVIPILGGVLLLTISGLGCIYWKKKFAEVKEDWESHYGPQRFSYRSLYKATKRFSTSELLGLGGFGKVYRGEHHSKGFVAVKIISHDAEQGMKEFVSEIVSMGRLRHKNLVPLLGYCRRKGELLLVYEYMQNGSLDDFLFGKEQRKLDWKQRFHIIKGVALAILYLHEQWEQVVLHRDIKASNVLLDANLNARLGDFGFARFHDRDTNLQTTHVVGTVGYMSPELSTLGVATTKTDIYAFGAFMLEVVCGRRPIDPTKPRNQMVLLKWLVEMVHERGIDCLIDVVDPKLRQAFDKDEVELTLKLGLLCCQLEPEFRPSIGGIINILERSSPLPNIEISGAAIGRIEANNNEGSTSTMTFPSIASFGFESCIVTFQGR